MPIEFIERFKEQDLSVADLELEASTDEGYIIKDIEGESSVVDALARVIIKDTTMLNFPMVATTIGIAPIINRNSHTKGLFERIREVFPDVPLLKVSEGEKFVITTLAATGTARIRYIELSGGDIPPVDSEGASLGKSKLFISHGKQNFSIAATATEIEELTTSLNPAGMFKFPFGAVCPANYSMELLGFAIGNLNKGANLTINGFRIWHIDKAILAEDESFLKIESFPYLPNNKNNKLYLLPDKIVINAGNELKIEFSITNAAGAAETVDMYCTMLFKQNYLG